MRLLASSFSPPPSSQNPPHTNSKTNSTVLFARNIIIVIGVMFVICGLLHLLVRYLIKRKRSSNSHFQSSRFLHENSGFDDGGEASYERQLRQLFNLHDSGLDQAFIDALPVFSYKELMGLKEPFDCAVCLCEFTNQDNLRLLPLCSHAFHMHCIDTWLLSNSTCPLCRGTLFTPGFSIENPVFEFNDSREEEDDDVQGHFGHFKQSEASIGISEKRVYSVRLGKFRATTNVGKREEKEVGETSSNSNFDARRCYPRVEDDDDARGYIGHFKQSEGSIGIGEKRVYPVRLGKFRATNVGKGEEKEVGETSSSNSNFDARRCYSMGSYEYVVGDSELRVAFVPNRGSFGNKDVVTRVDKDKGCNSSIDDGNKLSNRSKGESFSVSKIWLWSKKDHHHKRGQISATHHTHVVNSSVNVSLPLRNADNTHS